MIFKRKKLIVLILVLLIVPVGFYSKLYSGIGSEWVNNKLGGVFYEMFWCFVFYLIIPEVKPFLIALWVFIITCLLELVQLFDYSFLQLIRSNFIGQTILGNSFSWSDFPYYAIGSLLGFFILTLINRIK